MASTILRGVFAVLVGYLVFQVAIVLLFFYFVRGPQPPGTAFLLFSLVYGFVFAFEGGYIAGLIGKSAPLRHAWMLAVVTLAMWLGSTISAWGKQPAWFQFANLIYLPGILLGGLLRERRARSAAAIPETTPH